MHAREFVVVWIGRVVTGLEHDRVVGREARERVDVRVGVVALQVSVIEPEHAFGAKRRRESARLISSRLIGGWR